MEHVKTNSDFSIVFYKTFVFENFTPRNSRTLLEPQPDETP